MQLIKAGIIAMSMIIGCVCCVNKDTASRIDREDFPDILDVKNVPEDSEDWSAFCLSDLGAWFGYALPDDSTQDSWGSFPGPFMMSSGRWLSKDFMKLFLFDSSREHQIKLSGSENASFTYYPGQLVQRFTIADLDIDLQLIFVSSRSVLVKAAIKNRTAVTKKLRIGWTGSILSDKLSFQIKDKAVTIDFPEDETSAHFTAPVPVELSIAENGLEYKILNKDEIEVSSNKTHESFLAFSLCFNSDEWIKEQEKLAQIFAEPNMAFKDNKKRWNSYVNTVLAADTKWAKDRAYQRIAVKALMTLINNWRCAHGDLLHDGLFPSYAVSYFNGFWAWDSWKHSVALRKFAPELAKNQIRTMFDYQDEHGMVADVIYADKTENNWRDTKPPLACWSVWKVYESAQDRAFLEEMYPKILKYHKWWYENRDHDQNDLCEYGATDGTLIASKWESGMDDAVRFDEGVMVQNNEHAWSVNQESVDLNSYLYADKLYLANIAETVGEADTAIQLKKDAENVKRLIQSIMFDKETGYFYDVKLEDKSFIKHQGPEGWIPLWAGVATPEQAERVKEVVTDTDKFATYIPFPTVAADDPGFRTGYWRGPVWLDQAYFGVKALKRYGFGEEADTFTRQLFDRLDGLKNAQGSIRENYDPIDGKGLRVNHFSWSAAHLLMLFWGE